MYVSCLKQLPVFSLWCSVMSIPTGHIFGIFFLESDRLINTILKKKQNIKIKIFRSSFGKCEISTIFMYFFINDLNYSTYFLFLVCEMSQLCVHFFTVSCGVLNKDVINLKQLYRQYLCCVCEGGLLTYTWFPIGGKQAVVMVPIPALTVIPAGQVDTSGFTVALDKAVRTLINIWRRREDKKRNEEKEKSPRI